MNQTNPTLTACSNVQAAKLQRGLAVLLIALSCGASAFAATGDKATYEQAKADAKQHFKAAEDQCKSLAGNDKDVCVAKAKADRVRAESNAEATYKGTEKAAYDAKVDIAKADFELAKQKCDAQTGNAKDVCRKEADAQYTTAKEQAKANHKAQDAKNDANEDIRDANYKAQVEKCDALSGNAKDACVAKAKAAFGK